MVLKIQFDIYCDRLGKAIYYVDFFQQKVTDKWTWAINTAISPSTCGYSGFQYVQIV